MRSQFTSYEQLPITLTADHVAAALGISRANAYILLRSDGFPTLHIGKRMVGYVRSGQGATDGYL